MAVSAEDIRIKVFLESLFDDKGSKRFRSALKGTKKDATLLGMSLKSVGALAAGAFTVAGAAKFVGFLSKAADESARLEKGLLEIGTLMGGLTKGEISTMRAELHDLAVESGQAVDTLVKAKYDVVSAGFSDAADSALLLDKSARLAVGGVTDVSTSADLLTTILNAYQLEAKDAGVVSDDLFTIVRNGKTTMNELGSQMGQVIAIAGPLGVELDEVGAAISTLTAQGQSTAIATTAISAAVSELSKPSKELQAALAAVGIESDNLIKSGGGLKGALDLVKKASDGTGISVDKLVGREEALRTILPLVSTASKKFARDLESMDNNAGEADKAFRQMAGGADHLKSQVERAFESARDAVGEAITSNEDYKDLLKKIKEGVDKFAKSVRDGNPDFDAFVSNLMKMGSDVVKNAPGYIDAIATAAGGVYEKVKPLIDFAKENPDVIEYGIIGAIVYGKKGAAIGGFIASLDSFVDSGKFDKKMDDWARKKQGLKPRSKEEWDREINWAEYYGKIESPFRGDSQIKEMMGLSSKQIEERFKKSFEETAAAAAKAAEKAAAAAAKAAEEQKKLGESSGNTSGKVTELGSAAGDANEEAERWVETVKKAVEWEKKEYEAIEGLYEAQKKYEEVERQNAVLLKAKIIDLPTYTARVEDATEALDYFKASADGAFQADIDKMVKDRPDIFGDFTKQQYRIGGQTIEMNDEERESFDAALERADEQIDALYTIADSLDVMGYDLKGAGNFASAIEQMTLASKLGEIPGADPTNTRVRAVGNLLMGVGANIGGDVGGAIASTAGMALAGLEIAGGNPVGAVIGGVVGLVGSLFGGGSDYEQKRAARDNVRRQIYEQIVSSALSGGSFSAELLRAGEYNYDSLKNLKDPGYPDAKYDTGMRLFEDRGIEELNTLSEFVGAMDEIGAAMDSVTKTSLASTLDQLVIKYEYLETQVEGYIDTLEAQQTEIASAVLGITADSMMTMFDAAIETAEDADHAGRMIAEALELQIVDSFKMMAISQAVNEAVMPMLQPVLNELVAGALSGGLSAGEMTDLVLQAQDIAASVAPAVSALYGAFDEAGVINYAYSSKPIEGRATGGPVIANRPYFVGERGIPELFVPDSNGQIIPGNELGGSRPIQVIVQVANHEFETMVTELADNVFVKAERRKGVVNAQKVFG